MLPDAQVHATSIQEHTSCITHSFCYRGEMWNTCKRTIELTSGMDSLRLMVMLSPPAAAAAPAAPGAAGVAFAKRMVLAGGRMGTGALGAEAGRPGGGAMLMLKEEAEGAGDAGAGSDDDDDDGGANTGTLGDFLARDTG